MKICAVGISILYLLLFIVFIDKSSAFELCLCRVYIVHIEIHVNPKMCCLTHYTFMCGPHAGDFWFREKKKGKSGSSSIKHVMHD
jgi:hypothetical protein